MIWPISASSRPARQSLDLARGRVLHKSAHLKSMRPASAQTEAAFSIFDNARHFVKPLFTRAGPCGRLRRCFATFPSSFALRRIPRLDLPPPVTIIDDSHRLTSSLDSFAVRSYRRLPRYARASSRSLRTVVSLNAQLIHRVFTQCLTRALPSVSMRCLPRRAYWLLATMSSLLD